MKPENVDRYPWEGGSHQIGSRTRERSPAVSLRVQQASKRIPITIEGERTSKAFAVQLNSMMSRLFVIADDLTGAADCAARCFHNGLSSIVDLGAVLSEPIFDVNSFSSETRWLSIEEAGQQTRDLVRPFSHRKGIQWYKKMDSLLRGNFISEIEGMVVELGYHSALICPANPAQGRTIVQGCLVSSNQPQETKPLPEMLANRSNHKVIHVPIDRVREGSRVLGKWINRELEQGQRLITADAETEEDLNILVGTIPLLDKEVLLCGSAGLIHALTANQPGTAPAGPPALMGASLIGHNGRTLFIIGSGCEPAHQQIDTLLAGNLVEAVEPFQAPPDSMDRDFLLHLARPGSEVVPDRAESRETAIRFGSFAADWITRLKPDLVLLAGGDTAKAVLDPLGIAHLVILCELLPGIPLAWASSQTGLGFNAILKPGSFGGPAVLEDLHRRARGWLNSQRNIPD